MTALRTSTRLLACGLLSTAAGLAASAPPNPDLRNTHWSLQSIDGTPQPAAPGAHLVFDAKSQHLGGHAGCNAFKGRFTQRGTQLALSPLATTRKACAPALQQQEQQLLQVLAATDAYRIEGPVLSLLQGDAVRATFQAIPAVRK
jgi:putative lipoprotein